VPEGKTVKNRLHLDVNPTDREQDEEVRRLLDLGARHADVGQGDESWVCLADPEGCLGPDAGGPAVPGGAGRDGGCPDQPVVVSDEIRDLSRSTWEKYAYNLGVWLSFLSAYGCLWDEADAGVQEAFKFWRVLDERNERLVSLGTYEHDLIAIRLFYVWADGEYGVGNPIRMRRSRGRRRGGTFTERPETAPKAVRDRDVKWFAPAGYARYRDVGLLGLTVDGDDDPSFRGRNSQRDGAFADGLYGTGLRLREWGSVLLMELPPDDRNRADHGGRHAPLPEPGFQRLPQHDFAPRPDSSQRVLAFALALDREREPAGVEPDLSP
jgi:hypothetical protein